MNNLSPSGQVQYIHLLESPISVHGYPTSVSYYGIEVTPEFYWASRLQGLDNSPKRLTVYDKIRPLNRKNDPITPTIHTKHYRNTHKLISNGAVLRQLPGKFSVQECPPSVRAIWVKLTLPLGHLMIFTHRNATSPGSISYLRRSFLHSFQDIATLENRVFL